MTYQQQLFPLEDEFTIADVGSPLLEDLAKGVYEPDEVIREYVQNAVDAHRQYRSVTGAYPAQPIHLEVRGKQLTIYDYGIGMDETEVRRVKAVAISQKRESDGPLTGYKGLGIWAGLSFFKNLTLITTKTGCDKKYVLTINFRKIVESLSPQAHIGDVLNPNYDIGWQPADINDHYTIVTLDDPDEKRYPDRFLDPVAVADAVRRICPCEIDENFVFHGKLMEWYEANHIDLYPILVNGQKIVKSFPSVVEDFDAKPITINDTTVAVRWSAVNQNSRILRPSDDQLIGFRLIENGFALGGANPYSEPDLPGYNSMPRNNYVNWHIGEIHIISPSLKPNLKRNKLEESEDARQFVERLRYFYRSVEYSDRVLSKRRDLAESYQTSKGWIENKLALPQLDLNLDDQSRVAKLRRELRDQDSRARTRSRSSERGSEDVDALKQVSNARHQLLGLVEQVIQRHFSETGGAHQGGVPLGAPSSQQQPPVQNATNHNPPPSPPQPITQTQSPTSPSPVTSTAPGTSNSWSTAQAGSDLASAVFSTGSGGTTDSVATQDSNEATERTTAGFADDSVDDAQELLVSEAEILISIAEEVLDSELHDNIALRDRILRKIRSRFMRVLQHE